MEEHPTAEDFRNLLQQSTQPRDADRNAFVVRHLLAGCEICRSTLQRLRGAGELLSRMFGLPLPSSQELRVQRGARGNYDWAFSKAARTSTYYLTHGGVPENLPDRLAELSGLPEGEQLRRVNSDERLSSPELIRFWVEQSNAVRYQSLRKTLHFAQLARSAAATCKAERAPGGQKELADLQAYAWGAYGNAQRMCSDLLEAERALALAFQKAGEGSGSLALQAFLLARRCALYNNQGRLKEALSSAEEEVRVCRELGDRQLLAIACIQKAIALIYNEQAGRAAEILQDTIPSIDADTDPYLLLAAHHNLARCYVDLDQPSEALAVHCEMRELYQNCKAPLILLRGTWQEGQLLRKIGHLHNAESALLRARQGFEEEGLAYEMAMVCLELADLYLESDRFDQARSLLSEAIPIFRSLRVSREILAALLRLQQATQGGTADGKQTAGDSVPAPLLFPGAPPHQGGPDDL